MTILQHPFVCGVPDLFCVNTMTASLYLINKYKHNAINTNLISFIKLSFSLCNRMRVLNAYCLDPSIVF